MSQALYEPAKTQRLQVELTIPQIEALQKLMAICGIETRKELINNALTLLEWAVEEVQKGNDIVSLNKKEKHYEVLRMPALMNAARFGAANEQSLINSKANSKTYTSKTVLNVVS